MLVNNNSEYAYNDFTAVPQIPYKIVEALITSTSIYATNLFKCLKYSESDCLSKPELTLNEKRKLIWSPDQSGWTKEQDFKIFLKPLIGNSLDSAEQQTQIRIYEHDILPQTKFQSILSYSFDLITEEKTSLIYNDDDILVERTSYMQSCILAIMNGRDIAIGQNYFQFSRDFDRYSGSILNISNSKSFYGRTLIMGLLYSNLQKGGEC